jgi:hypothetical protein
MGHGAEQSEPMIPAQLSDLRFNTFPNDSICRPVVEIADQAAPEAVCAPRLRFPTGGELIQVKNC